MRLINAFKAGYRPENAHKTQVKNTVNTYQNIMHDIVTDDVNILDYGSGLGYGSKLLHDNGYLIKSYEPYYNNDKGIYKPDYIDYWSINGKYNVIISNCVLNVVPDDIRKNIVKRMFKMLAVDGLIYVNVNSKHAIKKNNGQWLSDNEVLTTKGTYQKGFTRAELKAELKDILSPYNNVSIENSNHANNGIQIRKLY